MVAVIFPFAPQIRRGPYTVTHEYRTDVITTRSGREQRRALRQTPRKRVQYMMAETGDCLRAFDRAMLTAQAELLAIPDRVRYATIAAGIAGSGTTATVDAVPLWLVDPSTVVLMAPGRQALRTVTDITGLVVTFAESEATAWPADTRLHPALQGYLAAQLEAPLVMTRGVIETEVSFEVDPGSEPAEDAGTAAVTLGGHEVFLTRPDKFQPINLTRQQDGAEVADYGMGRVSRYFPIAFATRVMRGHYTACSPAKAELLRQLFQRMQGRRGEFLMPTFQADMVPVSGLTAAGTTLTVEGTEVDAAYDGSTVFKAVAIRLTSGTWITRLVSGLAPSGGNTVVTVTAAWGVTVEPSGIDYVSWLPLWRFGSDELAFVWQREDVAQITPALQMLEYFTGEA